MSTNGTAGHDAPDHAARAAAAAAQLAAAQWAEVGRRQATIRPPDVVALRDELLAHYDGLGPLYPLYVERLVQAHLRATRLDALGEAVEPPVHRGAAEEVRRSGAALQRYTESLKQEIIAKRVEMQVVRVVEIIEAVVLPVAPQLWNEVIAALAERAPSLE